MSLSAKEQADFVANGLKDYYFKYIAPVEKSYHFDKFMTPIMTSADFMANPMVLLMGQYSVGKTTFIRFLLGRDFPGCRIGPEPTTDKFAAVMYGTSERVIPGNAAAVQKDKPFRALESFGMAFLNRFEVSEVAAPILEHITLVDSPGILSGEKQRVKRGYDFPSVINYWATRADRVLLLFDAHKLDISDEFKSAIVAIKGNFDKIRCVLNKADQVSQQQLMRVYGALLWSLGKVVQTPEVMRVYISSFWEEDYRYTEAKKLFDLEKSDLLSDLKLLPRGAALRKVNEFVKRTRRAKVHALTCETLRSKFGFMGKEKKQRELLNSMPAIFKEVSTKHNVPLGDFPNPAKFAKIIANWQIWKFPQLKPASITAIDEVLGRGVAKLVEQVEYRADPETGMSSASNPFASEMFGGGDSAMSIDGIRWVVSMTKKQTYDEMFYRLAISDGKATGAEIKQIMIKSGLAGPTLGSIWGLSDLDKDGKMNSEEFALCMHLIEEVSNGKTLPKVLPESYIPPSFLKKVRADRAKAGIRPAPPTSGGGGGPSMSTGLTTSYSGSHAATATMSSEPKRPTMSPPAPVPTTSTSSSSALEAMASAVSDEYGSSAAPTSSIGGGGLPMPDSGDSGHHYSETVVDRTTEDSASVGHEYAFSADGAW